MNRIFRISVIATVIASFVATIINVLRQPEELQWDLKVYYHAPLFGPDVNPYIVNHFVYPPVFLPVFKVFSDLFTYDRFFQVFLFAKIIALLFLLAIWKFSFLKKTPSYVFAIFVWLGFYATIMLDLRAGNISIFETTLLFLGFLCFVNDRVIPFILCTLLAASFKITPLFFLILLVLSPSGKRLKSFAAGCAGYVGFVLLNWLLFPDFSIQFVREALARTNESGQVCPSSMALINDAFIGLFTSLGMASSPLLAKTIYLAFAAFILFFSWKAWNRRKPTGDQKFDRIMLVMFSILVYSLTVPRMKDYAYMLAIPSVLFAIENFEIKVPRWLLFLPLVLISPQAMPILFRTIGTLFWDYYPLLVAAFFWHFYFRRMLPVAPPYLGKSS